MKFSRLPIDGLQLIESTPFSDERGVFRRGFCQQEFNAAGVVFDVKQTNISENFHRHTLRGFHFQMPPFGEDKVLTPMQGAVFNVTVDVRPDSPTFLQHYCIELRANERHALLVPKGCANAFLTLADQTTMLYYMSEFYSPVHYYGFRFDDPLFAIHWPAAPAVISAKDASFIDFDVEAYRAEYYSAGTHE